MVVIHSGITSFIPLDKSCISVEPQILHLQDKKIVIENTTSYLYTIN